MKRAIILASFLLALAPATMAADQAPQADGGKACINPHFGYNARSLNQHEIYVRNAIGKPRPALRLTTSCLNLDPAIGIGLSSSFTCIGLGDPVVATTVDGHVESCVVTHIAPYAPAKGDLHG